MKKLRITKETLRTLSQNEAQEANGGIQKYTIDCPDSVGATCSCRLKPTGPLDC